MKYLRILPFLVCWILMYQFSKEIFYLSKRFILGFYQTAPGELFLLVFKEKLHFNAGEPDWLTKIVYTIIYVPLYMFIVHLYFGSRQTTKVMFVIIGGVFAGAMIFNILGKITHLENMVTMSRNTLDLIVSPFMLVFLIPVLKLKQNFQENETNSKT